MEVYKLDEDKNKEILTLFSQLTKDEKQIIYDLLISLLSKQ